MSGTELQVPVEAELIEFFRGDPVERQSDDGYWCYETRKLDGAVLRLSFNVLEGSVQAQVSTATGQPVATAGCESARLLTIYGPQLRCEFGCGDCSGILIIDASRDYAVSWSVLRSR
jgi:hypothetical protein